MPFGTLAKLYRLEQTDRIDLSPRLNLAPTEPIPIVRAATNGSRRLDLARWGLIPRWARDRAIGSKTFNARVETLSTKPAFRDALAQRRCIVLADAFYEWKTEGKRKVPHAMRMPDGAPFAMAGLWDVWTSPDGEVIESCTVVTRAALGVVAELHNRMPVVIDPAAIDTWLDAGQHDAARLVALLESAVLRDFVIERLDAVPFDVAPPPPRQMKLFG